MGSRTVSPRAPTQPQIVYVPAQTTSTNTPSASDENQSSETSSAVTDEQRSETRTQNLLQRDRSRFGTVLSGFRGVLGLSDNAPQRKSLLGE